MDIEKLAEQKQQVFEDAFVEHIEDDLHAHISDNYEVLEIDESDEALKAGMEAVMNSLSREEREHVVANGLGESLEEQLYKITDFSKKRFRLIRSELKDLANESKSYNRDPLGHVGMRQSDFLR